LLTPITVICAFILTELLFKAVKDAIFPTPLAAKPMFVFVLLQVYEAPETLPIN